MVKPILCMLLFAPIITSAATVSGTVTDAISGLPIEGATVGITDPQAYFGQPLVTTSTDVDGNYMVTLTVDPAGQPTQFFGGDPAVVTGQVLIEIVAPMHAPQRAGDTLDAVDCFWFCELNPDLSPVVDGALAIADTDNLDQDFVLSAGATISGSVTSASGGPLADVPVNFFGAEPFEVISAATFVSSTDVSGNYTSGIAFKPGTYFAGAGNRGVNGGPLPYGNFVSQGFGGFTCEFLACFVRGTNPIAIAGSTPASGIDFALNPGGLFTGELLYADSGLPLASPDTALIRVWTPDEGRNLATFFVNSDRFGGPIDSSFRIEGLSGSYIIEIDPGPSTETNLLRVLNDGSRCPFSGCDRGQGVPVTLLPGSPVTQNFSLVRGGKLTGTMVDDATGLGIDGGSQPTLVLLDAMGRTAGGAIVNSDGQIITADGVAPGDYRVTTGTTFFANSFSGQGNAERLGAPYIDQTFMGVDCPGLACDFSAPGAATVTITAGAVTSGIDFSLRQGFQISGTLTDSVSGDPLAGRNVEIFTPSGQRVALEFSAADGSYTTGGLPDGNYRVVVKDGGRVVLGNFGNSGLGYFGKVFGSTGDCVQNFCSASSGSNVVVAGANVTGIDFSLTPGPTISGQVVDTVIGLPVLLTVDVFNAGGSLVGSWSTVTSPDATYTTGALTAGTYTLIPRTTNTYSIGSPATVVKGASPTPGTLSVEITDSSVSVQALGVFQSLVFGSGFETL
ncbi:MAG: carboxypeptidase regulatory-like domain-containing protein [Lysobacterales bacterium]